MNTRIQFFLFITCLFLSAQTHAQIADDFIMHWWFVDSDGSDPHNGEDACECGTVYLINKSTSENNPIGDLAAGNYYQINKWNGGIGPFIASIPAEDWKYDEIWEVNLPCSPTFSGTAFNFRVRNYGPGVSPYSPTSRHLTWLLNTHSPSVDAGPDQTICFPESTVLDGTAPVGSSHVWNPGGLTDIDPTVSPGSTTTYTLTTEVTYTGFKSDQITCSASDQVTINVNYGPNLYLYDRLLCTGDDFPILHTGTSGASYDWKFTPEGGLYIVDISTDATVDSDLYGLGTYYVTVYGSNGCKSEGTIEVSMDPSATLDPNFSHTITSPGTGFSTIDMTAYETGAGLTHMWGISNSNAAGDDLGSITLVIGSPHTFSSGSLADNNYYLLHHGVKGSPCNEWKMYEKLTYPSSGGTQNKSFGSNERELTGKELESILNRLQLNENEISVVLYPNPASSSITIESASKAENQVIIVYDVLGKVVLNSRLSSEMNETRIDVSTLNTGAYFYSYQIDGVQMDTGKLIIE